MVRQLQPPLDPDACYQALLSRDARFDGHFYTAVKTTGIYCRPVCKVRAPLARNCVFFSSAARAEAAGFRPCLRCRPELAPATLLPWSTQDASQILASQAVQLLDSAEARYVSRGGLKLEGALNATGWDVRGWRCLDVGQSTGGFTDCLLQQGAAQVVGIDVGHAQVHPRIQADERVVCIEGVNARELEPDDERIPDAAQGFDLLVGDVSFISLTLVLPGVVPLLKPGGRLLMLVKPQFELQPGQVGKGGIVRDASLYAVVEQRIRTALAELGLQVRTWLDSPIEGGDGNREFFVQALKPAN